jgi:hypothetical protein
MTDVGDRVALHTVIDRLLEVWPEHWSEAFVDDVNGVIVQFGRDDSGICYELIEPLGPDSPFRPR